MNAPLVRCERREDGVALVTLDSPKVNALSTVLLGQLRAIADDLTRDPAGAVVVWGGERIFAAGADISEFGGPAEARTVGGAFHSTLDAVAAIPSFVVAAVSGYALGGGCELALACDYRIASTKAVFGQPEILLGIIPGGGGTQRLPRTVGASRAKEMMLTGRQVRAEEALAIGLADEVVEHDALLDRALALAAEVARGPRVAQRALKRVVDAGLDVELAAGLKGELAAFEEVFASDDARIGVQSFRENGPGKAVFTGR